VAQEWGRTTRELRERFPDTNAKKTEPRVLTLAQEMLGEHRPSLLALLGAVLTVALLACVNIAALSALRAFAREGELAVRRALGASSLDLARLQALETAALVAAGGVLGLALARAALGTIVALVPVTLPRAHDAAIDWSVVGVVLLAAGATAALGACLPLVARAGARADPVALRIGTRATEPPVRQRLRRSLAVLQVAAAFALLVATALHLETYARLQAEGPGVRTDGLVQVRLSLPPRAYPDQQSLETYVARLRASLLTETGVQAAAVASALPLSGFNARSDFVILGREPRSAAEMPGAQLRWVSPGFTEALGLPVRSGRPIEEDDLRSHAAVGLVDERLARSFWGDADPVGTSVRLEAGAAGSGPEFRIVGVVGNVKHFDLADAPLGTLYLPVHGLTPTLRGFFASGFTLAVAGRVDGGAERARIAEAVRRVDPEVSASTMSTMREALARSQSARRFSSGVLSVFAATALLLSASGLYSLVAAAAHARRREWGVRLALGATPSSVTRALLRSAALTLAAGLAAGTPVALAVLGTLGRGVAPELESRPWAWLGIPVALTVATLVAVLPPALRAARVDVARILGDA
jgi:putative ABC transport system permease protein